MRTLMLMLFAVLFVVFGSSAPFSTGALAGPSADVARRCMQYSYYSYIAYPYKRPGSVRMSGDRQAYFGDCTAKEGNIPEPVPARSST